MIAIAIDDEQLMLYALLKAVKASEDVDEVAGFSNCDEALDWLEINTPDVAFLDINMRGINGLALAEKITAIHPDCKIVFCTGYEEYAVSAFKIHASGYLIKPVSAEDVQKEIDIIKGRKIEKGILKAKCFGNFDVSCGGEKLTFKRTKSKEMLAYLIDRNGADVSSKEIAAALWEDGTKEYYDDTWWVGDQEIIIEPMTEAEAQELYDFISSVNKPYSYDEDLMNIITRIRDEFDMTILLIEHDMKFVSGLCDEVTV